MFNLHGKKINSLISIILCLFLTASYTQASSYEGLEQSVSTEQEKHWQQLIQYFHAAARLGDVVVIEELVSAGFPINIRDRKGYSALMIAAYNGRPEAIDRLLVLGANACAEDKRGNTAVMAAIFKGELRIAKRLIAADCDENHQNNAGQTPLMYASLFGRKELQTLLINHGADENKADHSGNTAASINYFNDEG